MTSPAAIAEKSWRVITISPFPKRDLTSLKKKTEVWGLWDRDKFLQNPHAAPSTTGSWLYILQVLHTLNTMNQHHSEESLDMNHHSKDRLQIDNG